MSRGTRLGHGSVVVSRRGWSWLTGGWSWLSSRVVSSGGGLNWAPGGVLGDNVVDGDGSSGNPSWGDVFGTDVFFTVGDGDQSGGVLSSSSGGDVSLSRGNSGDGSDGSDSRELHC